MAKIWLVTTRALVLTMLCGGLVLAARHRLIACGAVRPASPALKAVLLTGGQGPFWQQVQAGAQAAAEELRGKVQVISSSDWQQQLGELNRLNPSACNGLAICPLDAKQLTPSIASLTGSMSVVTLAEDAPQSGRATFVTASNDGAGHQAAQMVHKVCPAGGKVLVLADDSPDYQEFEEGIQAQFTRYADYKQGNYQLAPLYVSSESSLLQAVQSDSEVIAIVGFRWQHASWMARIRQATSQKLCLVAMGAQEQTLDSVQSGAIDATIAEDPYGYGRAAIVALQDFRQRDQAGQPLSFAGGTWTVVTKVLTKANLPAWRRQRADRLASLTVR